MNYVRLFLIISFLQTVVTLQSQNIHGGDPVDISQVPWQVSIELLDENDGTREHLCGGSILSNEWLLTAAHCIKNRRCLTIHAGATDQTDDNEGQIKFVDRVVIHPDYNPSTGDYDLALIHIEEPLTFGPNVQAIDLVDPQTNLAEGTEVYITGWGQFNSNIPCCSEILLGGYTNVIDNDAANILLGAPNNTCGGRLVNDNMIAFYNEDVAAGNGDSGGPAIIYQNEVPKLIGVTSWGGCPDEDFPSIYAKVNSASELINENISSNGELTVSADTEISGSDNFFKTINILSGATLTLNGTTLHMAENSTIIVEDGAELVMDRSNIIANCDLWKGIKNSGKVTVSNQFGFLFSTIEGAEIGIEILNAGELDIQSVQGSSFGMKFKNCTINAIRAIDANAVMLNQCSFENCAQAIILTYPSGNSSIAGSMYIDHCDFVNNNEDVKIVSAGGLNNVQISNNMFSGLLGANLSGDNAFTIFENTFSNECVWSTFLYSTGSSNLNVQRSNDISSLSYGVVALFDNSMYQFDSNCFVENGIGDVIVNGMIDHQGTQNFANANCFTDDEKPDISAYTNDNPFTYWEPDPNGPVSFNDCVYSETETPDGYNPIQLAFDGVNSKCNLNIWDPNGDTGVINNCNVSNNLVDITNAISNTNSQIANIDQLQFSSNEGKQSELSALNRCLINFTNQLANYYFTNNMISEAVDVYNSHELFDMQIKGYFILVNQQQYLNARNYLNQLNTSNSEQNEFVTSSIIYLNALESLSPYILSSQEEISIYQAATKSDPLAGYSRSIWMYFTGEDIRMNIILPNGETNPRNRFTSNTQIISSKLYPNPSSDEFHIEVNGLGDNTFGYEIFNFEGRLLKKADGCNFKHKINTINLQAGIYICRIYNEKGKQIDLHKMHLLR